MSTRLDLALRKFPEHEDGIRLLAARDPSGNLKYLDWGARMLAAKQALATEVADVIDLFHQFRGRPFGRRRHHQHNRIHSDLYAYRPQDLARLRDALLKIKRATDKKRHERERLYRIEGTVEADVVYDSPDLTVRHIKNKQASLHYGLSTKWCISMSRERYFEEYESHNATFFFFERKAPVGDEFDKVAVMFPRGDEETAEAFTSTDRRVDMMALAKVYGLRVFDIFRGIYERSEQYPGSVLSCVYAGSATQEQLESVLASIVRGDLNTMNPYERSAILEAICCNDAAPPTMLETIAQDITKLSTADLKRRGKGRQFNERRFNDRAKELVRVVMAALVIHPQTSADLRGKLTKDLRRRHVDIDKIHRVIERGGRIGVQYREPRRTHYRRSRRRPNTVATYRAMAERFDRYAARARKKAKALQVKLAKKKKRGGKVRHNVENAPGWTYIAGAIPIGAITCSPDCTTKAVWRHNKTGRVDTPEMRVTR